MSTSITVVPQLKVTVGFHLDDGRITHHPEVTLRSLGEFELCADWAPAMYTGQKFARIAFKTIGDHGFDHRADLAAKVRNVSRVGSQMSPLASNLAKMSR